MRVATNAERGSLSSQDRREFEAFFEAEYDRLYGTMCMVTRSGAEAEDITQEAFLRAWVRWERVRTAPSPDGYLYRTAFNLFRNRLRSAKRAARRLLTPVVEPDPAGTVDERITVLDALGRLPPRARAAVVLTELLGFSSEEVGQMLGVKASSARSLATHGRAQLRRELGTPHD